jgi:hypothetical protein
LQLSGMMPQYNDDRQQIRQAEHFFHNMRDKRPALPGQEQFASAKARAAPGGKH